MSIKVFLIRSYDPDIEDFKVAYPTVRLAAEAAATRIHGRGWSAEHISDGHFEPFAIETGERGRMFHVAYVREYDPDK